MGRTFFQAMIALALVGVGAGGAASETVVLTPAKDNTLIESDAGLLSNGAGTSMFTGRTSRFGVRRALVAFPIAEGLPAQVHVDSVRLELTMEQTNSGASSVRVHRMLRDWGEGESFSTSGGGAQATIGDATWQHASYPDDFWSQPGGDFAAGSSATTLVDQAALYIWGSTQDLVSDVQVWVDDPATNFGWILVGDESQVSAKLFSTREGEVNLRPHLIVSFTRPTGVDVHPWSAIKNLYR